MKPTRLLIASALLALALPALAQDSSKKKDKSKSADKPPKTTKVSPFWQTLAPLEFTLTVNLKKVRNDRMDKAPWEWGKVSFTDSGKTVTLPVRVKTRGISRLKICNLFPPLWVDFNSPEKSDSTKKDVFAHVKRFKLVTPCKPPSAYERYALEEYNLYRLHALMTPVSHLTRLLHMTVIDSASGKPDFVRYAFAVEDADELASRLGGKKFAVEGATAKDMNERQTAMIGVLQYMIGNTDFSIYALHNAELAQLNGDVFPIAYDFDQAGVIDPPYAAVDPKLGIQSVKDRIYRGLCVPPDTVRKVIADIIDKRPAVYALYADTVGKLIGGAGVRESTHWFDQVYDELKDPGFVKNEILDKCRDVR